MESKIEKFIKKQKKEQREIIEKLRKIIRENFPNIKETSMPQGLWYEGKFYIATFEDRVNLGVGVNGLSDGEKNLFLGKGKTMRHLKLYSSDGIDEKKLLRLMRLVYRKAVCECDFKWRS
jgi:predicted DNA-binding protein (UPF0278 family)